MAACIHIKNVSCHLTWQTWSVWGKGNTKGGSHPLREVLCLKPSLTSGVHFCWSFYFFSSHMPRCVTYNYLDKDFVYIIGQENTVHPVPLLNEEDHIFHKDTSGPGCNDREKGFLKLYEREEGWLKNFLTCSQVKPNYCTFLKTWVSVVILTFLSPSLWCLKLFFHKKLTFSTVIIFWNSPVATILTVLRPLSRLDGIPLSDRMFSISLGGREQRVS